MRTFISNVILPLAIIGDASNGVGLEGDVGSEGKNNDRVMKPKTVPSLPFSTSNLYTLPRSASSATKAGVEPPQQSHATQLMFTTSSKMVIGVAMPLEGGEGIGACPITRPSPSLSYPPRTVSQPFPVEGSIEHSNTRT